MNNTRKALNIISEDEENEPTDQDLWDDVIAVTKGEKSSVSANGETVEAPNDGDGFDVYPSAYANGWASKMYKKLGGEWKTKDENITKKAMQLGFLNEDLDQWFDEEWVDVSETDEDGNHPPCGETSDSEERKKDPEKNYPKCVPKSKAKDMSDAEKEKLAKKKQKSVDSDDSDQSSEDGESDDPTYTSSDPDERFYRKKNRARITERKLRGIVREEIRREIFESSERYAGFKQMPEMTQQDVLQSLEEILRKIQNQELNGRLENTLGVISRHAPDLWEDLHDEVMIPLSKASENLDNIVNGAVGFERR